MNNLIYITEETINHAELIGEILAYILIGIALIFLVILIIGEIQQEKEEREYIKNLNEHDKAVILDYKNLLRFFPRKKKKEQKINE